MAHWLLTLQYDGSRYHGWQVQPNGVTVQQVLQDAVQRLTGVRSGITGCSRTDAGVHAEMFCCALHTDSRIPPEKVPAALNAHLPRDVAVTACRLVPDDFHPRYDARGKRYVYRIWNHPARNPFLEGRAYHYGRRLDMDAMNAAAAALVGQLRPAAVVCVDSLCSAEGQRLGRTVQFSDTGLYPAQADNARHLTRDTLGVPVVAAGIPTLMQAQEGADLVVTPRALDSVIAHGAALLAGAVNRALQPRLTVQQLFWLTG